MRKIVAGILMLSGVITVPTLAMADEGKFGADVSLKTAYLSRIAGATSSKAKENGFLGGVGIKANYNPIKALNFAVKGEGMVGSLDARGAVNTTSRNTNYGLVKAEGTVGPRLEAKSNAKDFDGTFLFEPYVGAGYFNVFHLGGENKTTYTGDFRQVYAKAGAGMTYTFSKESDLGLDKIFLAGGIKRQIDGLVRSDLAEVGKAFSVKTGNNRYSFDAEAGINIKRYKITASYEEFNSDSGETMGNITNKLASISLGVAF